MKENELKDAQPFSLLVGLELVIQFFYTKSFLYVILFMER